MFYTNLCRLSGQGFHAEQSYSRNQDMKLRQVNQSGKCASHPVCYSGDHLSGVGREHPLGASSIAGKDDGLVLLRDCLLSLAEKYPAHARSISQLAWCINILMYLPEAPDARQFENLRD